jgi:hypothetical protein
MSYKMDRSRIGHHAIVTHVEIPNTVMLQEIQSIQEQNWNQYSCVICTPAKYVHTVQMLYICYAKRTLSFGKAAERHHTKTLYTT